MPEASPPRKPWWRRRATKIVGSILAGGLIAAVIGAEYVSAPPRAHRAHYALIQTLSESFNSPVELDNLDISLFHGIEVNGYGLRIPYGYQPTGDPNERAGPLLSVQHFRFRTTLKSLLHHNTHVDEFRARRRGDSHPPARSARPSVRPLAKASFLPIQPGPGFIPASPSPSRT